MTKSNVGSKSKVQKDYEYYLEQQKAVKGDRFNSTHRSGIGDIDWLEFYSDSSNFEIVEG